MSSISNLSSLIAIKKLDLNLEGKISKTSKKYSSDWDVVKSKVDKLPKSIEELLKNVEEVRERNVGKSIRFSKDLEPIYYKNKKYAVELVVYEKDRVITRAYYVCFNDYEYVSYQRQFMGEN